MVRYIRGIITPSNKARLRRLTMVVKVREMIRCQHGQGLTEYAMVLSIVSIAAVATVTFFGDIIVNTFYTMINNAFNGIG